MTYTDPDVDPYPVDRYPAVVTPSDWLLTAYDNGWMRRESSTANRGYLANFREDHRSNECTPQCDAGVDMAHWPHNPFRSRYLGPSNDQNLSELYRELMAEDLPGLSPLSEGVAA